MPQHGAFIGDLQQLVLLACTGLLKVVFYLVSRQLSVLVSLLVVAVLYDPSGPKV